MDNLTHSLAGAALARSGLDRTTPLATATLVIAANAPDVDVLSFVHGPQAALAFRRGITHGVPALLTLPFLVAGIMLLWDRAVRLRRRPGAAPARAGPLLLLSAIGLASHPILDWMNTYGMRWWLPFDGSWSYGDALFIIDPWIWLALGAAVAPAALRTSRGRWGTMALVTATTAIVLLSPIAAAAKGLWIAGVVGILALAVAGRRERSGPVRAPIDPSGAHDPGREGSTVGPRWALAATAGYIAAMIALSTAGEARVRATLGPAQADAPTDVMVAPIPALPIRAEYVAVVGDSYLRGEIDWFADPVIRPDPGSGEPRISRGPLVSVGEAQAAIAAASGALDAAHYLTWSRFPIYRVERSPVGFRVWIGDARYQGRGAGGLEGLEIEVSADSGSPAG